MNERKIFWTAFAISALVLLIWITGCSWTAYNKTTDKNGNPEIHAGRLAFASDLDLDGLWFKDANKAFGVDSMKEEQDSAEIEVDPKKGTFKVTTKGE